MITGIDNLQAGVNLFRITQQSNIRKHKKVNNSVGFTNIELKFGVVVAESHP